MGILWIVTTQWRAQACGYAGDPNARTPNLDRLALVSTNYTQAVTPHPFGPFARAALLTGIQSPENGINDYFDSLPNTTRTIAHDLNDNGYSTAYFGKWHLYERDPEADLVGEAHAKIIIPEGNRGGFNFFEGFESGFLLNNPWLHGTRLKKPTPFIGYQSEILCKRAANWIKEEKKPWFCIVSLEAPHPPYASDAAGIIAPNPDTIKLRSNVTHDVQTKSKAEKELAGYYAHIEATDRYIGQLIDEIPKDTTVVFTSVHGDMHGSHGLFRKGWPYEESIRVPLLVRMPENYCQMTPLKTSQLVSLIDLAEWTRAWAGLKVKNNQTQQLQRISMPTRVKLPMQCDRAWTGMRTTKRKLIFNSDQTTWLYFDLENDPFEINDLSQNSMYFSEIETFKKLISIQN